MADPGDAVRKVREAVAACPTDPYLMTITADHTPHCATVTPVWSGERMVVAAPSSWPGSQAAGLTRVTLVWSPAQPGGRSLIADGIAAACDEPGADGGPMLGVTITRMVWYRREMVDGVPTRTADCIRVYKVAQGSPA